MVVLIDHQVYSGLNLGGREAFIELTLEFENAFVDRHVVTFHLLSLKRLLVKDSVKDLSRDFLIELFGECLLGDE